MIRAVVRKEMAVLWLSPIPYVIGALFQCVLAVLFVNQLEVRQQAVTQPLFPVAGFLLLVTAPVLCMRSFAEEARSGSLELLLAIPARARSLVLGKWVACFVTAVLVVAPAAVFAVLLSWWGDPDRGPAVGGFIGLVLLAAALTGVGVLASALTNSQPVAAMLSFFVALLLWFSHVGAEAIGAGSFLAHFSISERLRPFAGGVIDTTDVVFFVFLAVTALTVATTVVDARRLR